MSIPIPSTAPVKPRLKAFINFSDGPSFDPPFILGESQLGNAALATGTTIVADVSDQVTNCAIRRTYSRVTDTWNPSTAALTFVDLTGDFNPENASGPYYGLIKPMRKIQLFCEFLDPYDNLDSYQIWSGYIQNWVYTTANGADLARMQIQCYDAFLLFNNASVTTVAGAVAGETAGPRINAILDQVSWPSTMRSIDTGATTLQADPGTQRTVLNALQTVEESEFGALFMNQVGDVRFVDRLNYFRGEYDALTGGTFSDQPTLGQYQYQNVTFGLDDTLIQNAVTVTPNGMAAQYAENVESIATYFTHSNVRSGLLMDSTEDALQQAQAIVAARAFDQLRIDSMTCDISESEWDRVTAVITLGMLQDLRVIRHAPGQVIDQQLLVHGINHDITPNKWITTFQTLESVLSGFILGNVRTGVLGESVLGPY